jgi:dipeptidyl aminopeptidase/acylaminoacyl peptidase
MVCGNPQLLQERFYASTQHQTQNIVKTLLHSRLPTAALTLVLAVLGSASAQTTVEPPDSLVLDGLPAIPAELKRSAARYMEFRSAALNDWHPVRREILITTRFADTVQLHQVATPGGARSQLTFLPEPVGGASYRPHTGEFMVFSQDAGGGEFYQLYRLNPDDGSITLLTDGKSRNTGAVWARSGKWLAYGSTRRDGSNNDIYIMDPADPATDRLVLAVNGGGWSVADWSHDEAQLLLVESISITQSRIHLLDLKTGQRRQLTPNLAEEVSYAGAKFSSDDRSFFTVYNRGSEFRRLVEFNLPAPDSVVDQPRRSFSSDISWDVDDFDLSPDGRRLAFTSNENGIGVLRVVDLKNCKRLGLPNLPVGVVTNLRWHENSHDLAFNLSSAHSPLDVYSIDINKRRLERWTQSETGGANPARFVEPKLITFKSFDGLPISAFVYRPDPQKFPGKRPVLIIIHGGPESQARPGFQARNNYYVNELGLVLVVPNVRGSNGYGKTFLALDNGFKREDSVKDIGALLDLLAADSGVDSSRIAVMGGSYGGYMVLACMTHFSDRLRCGIDIVGISNFLTFLNNTQAYRRDLRRVEYGDERDEKMREFMARIAPTANVEKIHKPILVVQGKNDPRVPVTEAEQMVKAIRDNHGTAWYLMAKDEGHGFAKKKNSDFLFLTGLLFLQQNLLQ